MAYSTTRCEEPAWKKTQRKETHPPHHVRCSWELKGSALKFEPKVRNISVCSKLQNISFEDQSPSVNKFILV
jgi:hypothetical protein